MGLLLSAFTFCGFGYVKVRAASGSLGDLEGI